MTRQPTSTSSSRIAALDGLRGITIVLVTVNHAGGYLWPRDPINEVPIVRGLFSSGVVVVFFLVGALIVSRSLLAEQERGVMDPVRFCLRRLVRLGVQLVPLAIVLLLLNRFDPSDPYGSEATYRSVLGLLTYTGNVLAMDNFVGGIRTDAGHLWYLSVQQQCYLLLPLLIAVFYRRRVWFAALLAAMIVLVTINRFDVLETNGWVPASLNTWTRSDGLWLGVLIAVALPWMGRLRGLAPHLIWVSAVSMTALVAFKDLHSFGYLRGWGIAFMVASAALLIGLYLTERTTRTVRLLSWAPVARLGKASLAIFVWHMPVILFVSRHSGEWGWITRTTFATVLLLIVVLVAERWIEEPTRRWLATHLQPPRDRAPGQQAGSVVAAT